MSGRDGEKEFHLCCLELLMRVPFPLEYMMYTNVVMLRCPLVMSSFGCKCSPMARERGTGWPFLSELAPTFPVLAAQETFSLWIDGDLPHSSLIERCWWFLNRDLSHKNMTQYWRYFGVYSHRLPLIKK